MCCRKSFAERNYFLQKKILKIIIKELLRTKQKAQVVSQGNSTATNIIPRLHKFLQNIENAELLNLFYHLM